jgi:tetratricopeptide (TPR) repeat protein
MKRRPIFASDSDLSDDEIFLRQGAGPSTLRAREANTVRADPLFRNAEAFPEGEPAQQSFPAIATTAAADAIPESSKVTATRRNLSQLFGGGSSLISQSALTSAPSSSGAAAAADASCGGIRTSLDAAIHATLNLSVASSSLSSSSGLPRATSSPSSTAGALFAPRFTYEGPSNNSSAIDSGGSNHDALVDHAISSTGDNRATGLTTALHALVQTYRDSLPCGTCMLALCVPPSASSPSTTAVATSTSNGSRSSNKPNALSSSSSLLSQQLPPSAAARERLQRDSSQPSHVAPGSSSSGPLLLLMSSNRQVLCIVPLDRPGDVFEGGVLQLQQDRRRPQYLKFFYATPDAPVKTLQSASSPLSDAVSAACWWTVMFPDREQASEFLVATYTVAQYAAALAKQAGGPSYSSSVTVPTVRVLPPSSPASSQQQRKASPTHNSSPDESDSEDTGADTAVVRLHVPTTVHWRTWALRRVSRTTPYCLPGDSVDGVSPLSPRDVIPGAGALRDGIEAALIGMRSGESRLVFLTAEATRVQHPELTSPAARQKSGRRGEEGAAPAMLRSLDRPAVAYVTCVKAVATTATTTAAAASSASSSPAESATQSHKAPQTPPLPSSSSLTPVAAGVDATTNAAGALLQQLLLQTLQQPLQHAQPLPLPITATPASVSASSSPRWNAMERTLDRVMLQLGALYEKVDRLDIEEKLQRNNAQLEAAMKRVVGLAPQGDVAVEDTLKDRDALLASLERYRSQYEEANANYQRALEAMGRSTERAQALETDLRVQQDLWSRQRSDEAEQTRLKLLERDMRHRDELERVAEARYAAGKADGHAAGYREGRQAALTAVDGEGGVTAVMMEWRAKVAARDQQIVALKTALQDAKFHHERDRRQLRAEIDVLTGLNEKLQHLQANADVRMPEETTQQQCKRLKRVLNTVYAQVEAQVLALSQWRSSIGAATEDKEHREESASHAVAVDDVLAVVMSVITAEARSAVAQIKADGERRSKENADVRALTLARQYMQQRPTTAAANHHPNSTDFAVDVEAAEALSISLARVTASAPPPLPQVQTAASRTALAAVAASLLPEVSHVTASLLANDRAVRPIADDSLDTNAASASGTRSAEPVKDSSPFSRPTGSAGAASWSGPGVVEGDNAQLADVATGKKEGEVLMPIFTRPSETPLKNAIAPLHDRHGDAEVVPPEMVAMSPEVEGEGRGVTAQQQDRPTSPRCPSSPSSSASLYEAKPSRQAMRLPNLPPSPLASVAGEAGDAGPLSSLSPRSVSPASDATSVFTGATSDVEGVTPLGRVERGTRLFTSPPSFTKHVFTKAEEGG